MALKSLKNKTIIDQKNSKIDYCGKIRDSLHETIPFTKSEKTVIDSVEFQRLRRISQTAFTHYAFPGATHTRFEHSLGTMHVAHLMLNALISNQKKILKDFEDALLNSPQSIYNTLKIKEKEQGSLRQTKQATLLLQQSLYLTQCLRFAALLHDCGHSAFSHSGEKFMPTWKYFIKNIDKIETQPWLKSALEKKGLHQKNKNKKITHEIYTLLIICHIFQYHDDEFLSPKMAQDVCAILDLSLEPSPHGELCKSGMQNLFHEMISSELDADRMDYLLRDSQESGVIYGYFDLGRLLDSLGFYYNPKTLNYHLALKKSGVPAFEDYLRARCSMYQQIYFHKTVSACEAMLQHINKNLKSFVLPLHLKEYLSIDEHSFFVFFKKKCTSKKNSDLIKILSDLLYHRKLWKKIYEEQTIQDHSIQNSQLLYKITHKLEKMGFLAEFIENIASFTKFSDKHRSLLCENSFKIIAKDLNNLNYLEPFEKVFHGRNDMSISIKRIYVSPFKQNSETTCWKVIQKIISEQENTAHEKSSNFK